MTTNIYSRGDKLYLDYRTNGTRFRVASGLKDSREARDFIKANYTLFIHDKEQAQREFIAYSNRLCDARLKREDTKATQALNGRAYTPAQSSLNADFYTLFEKFKSACLYSERFNTAQSYRINTTSVFKFLAHLKIKNLNDLDLDCGAQFVSFFKSKGNCNATIRRKAAFFKRFLSFLCERGDLAKNIFKLPRLSPDERESLNKDEWIFDEKEIQALILNASGELKAYLQIAFFTGLREGEILGLQKKDIDFENNEIKIRRTRLKNGSFNPPKTKKSVRNVDILPLVRRVLEHRVKDLKKSEDLLFAKSGYVLRVGFKALLAKLGFNTQIPLYNTRHSFTSLMLSKGEDIEWVSRRMLGHTNSAITFSKYSKYLKKDIKERATFINAEEYL